MKPGLFTASLAYIGLVLPCGEQRAATWAFMPSTVYRLPIYRLPEQIETAGESRRVLLLVPPRPETTNPQAQPRIEQARAARRKARRKPRRRLFALPGTKPTPPSNPARSGVGSGKEANPTGNAVKSDDTRAKIASGGTSGDIVPLDQRATLAQALLADVLAERLHDRLGLTVVSENETEAALTALHLTRSEAARPENARRLCTQTGCQAVLMPRLTACVIQEGATRNVAVFARIMVEQATGEAGVKTGLETGQGKETGKRKQGKVEAQDMRTMPSRWPTQVEVAGTAFADRVLFHKQYKKPQGDLIRDAAQQAVNLLLHRLRTGEQAPFMRSTDRLAVAPVPAPRQVDKLVFTTSGRRVQPSAVGDLEPDVSTLFRPDLLPVFIDRIVESPVVRRALPAQDQSGAGLWQNEDTPNSTRVRALARALHVDYVLLARVADVELSEGASSSLTVPERSSAPADQERAARVEATAALVRASDGVLLWHDRATATMTAPMHPGVGGRPLQTDQMLIHDATRFALVDLERRLRKYRATFEN